MSVPESTPRQWHLFGPILGWEMTTLVRRRRYFAIRCAYVALLLLLLFGTYVDQFGGLSATSASLSDFAWFARTFFEVFGAAQLTAALVLTPAYVATAIADEKQRRTIDYLFATNLGNHEIVLGKLLPRIANLIILVFAGLPILSFAQLFGGVDPNRIVILTLLTLGCVFATAGLAILVSILTTNVRSALLTTYCCLAFLLSLPEISTQLEHYFHSFGLDMVAVYRNYEWFRAFMNVFGTLTPEEIYYDLLFPEAGATLVGAPPTYLWLPQKLLWLTGGMVSFFIVCVALAVGGLRRVHRRQMSSGARRKRSLLGWRRRSNTAVSDRPMLWKEWRLDGGFSKGTAGRFIVALLLAWFYLVFFGAMFDGSAGAVRFNDYLRIWGTLIIALTYFLVALRAADSVSVERDRNCWDSLLSTPLSAQEIIRAKLIACMKPVFGLVLAFLPVWAMAVYWNALSPYALLTLPVCLFVYGFATAALGVYHSVRRKSTNGALGATLGTCIILGGLGQFCVAVILMALIEQDVIDEQSAGVFLSALLPWGVLVGAAFRANDWNDHYAGDFATYCVIFLFVTLGVSVRLYQHSVGRLGLFSGRIESVIARSPMPVAKEVAPSEGPEVAQLASSAG